MKSYIMAYTVNFSDYNKAILNCDDYDEALMMASVIINEKGYSMKNVISIREGSLDSNYYYNGMNICDKFILNIGDIFYRTRAKEQDLYVVKFRYMNIDNQPQYIIQPVININSKFASIKLKEDFYNKMECVGNSAIYKIYNHKKYITEDVPNSLYINLSMPDIKVGTIFRKNSVGITDDCDKLCLEDREYEFVDFEDTDSIIIRGVESNIYCKTNKEKIAKYFYTDVTSTTIS